MSKGVAITGMGIISSIGNTVEENFQSLINKTPGISEIEGISTIHKDHIKVGEVKITNEELSSFLNLPASNNFSRTALLAEVAAKEAVKNAGITNVNSCKTGLISATSVGGMDLPKNFIILNLKKRKIENI